MRKVVTFFIALVCTLGVQASEYYVAIDGNDSNSGTLNAPFLTIQRAVDQMEAGDVCIVREGIYRDKVVIEKDDITIKAYDGEYVVLYGTKKLSAWQRYKGEIWCAKVGDIEPQFTQLIFKNKLQQMARYPDQTTGDMFRIDRESGYIGLETRKFGEIYFDAPLPCGEIKDYWKGGYFRAVAAKRGGTNPQGRISSSDGNHAFCDEINGIWRSSSSKPESNYLSNGPGDGYIFHLRALTTPGEWWYEDGYVYFWQPGGGQPDDNSVEVQSTDYILSANGVKGVKLEGINARLTGIELNDCDDCVIDGCDFRDLKGWFFRESYGHSMREIGGVYLNGRNIEVKNCYFTRSWGNLLNLDKCDGVAIDNCLFEDNGWMGMFTSSILSNSDNVRITNSTFGRTGRFHIRSDAHVKLDVLHCEFTDATKMCQDAGSIELTNSWCLPNAMDMKGSEFAYNIFHNMSAPKTYTEWDTQFACALYFEGCDNYTVHHSLFYNIANEKEDGTFAYLGPRQSSIDNIKYYNNTVWNIDICFKVWNFERDGHKGSISDFEVYNNIFEKGMENSYGKPISLYKGFTFKNNYEAPLSDAHELFDDTKNGDFTLAKGSVAIDAGIKIPGITDGYKGKAPDLGCYESGVEPWSCGSKLKVRQFFPDECGEIE